MGTDLHHSRSRNLIVVLIRTLVGDLTVFLLTVGTSFALETLRLQFFFCDSLLAGGAVGDVPRPDLIEDRIARDIETTLHAGGRRKGSMTLYNLFREHTSICFDVIDVLRVVGQQLPLIL